MQRLIFRFPCQFYSLVNNGLTGAWWMNKDIAVYLYSLIILSTKTEQIANKI